MSLKATSALKQFLQFPDAGTTVLADKGHKSKVVDDRPAKSIMIKLRYRMRFVFVAMPVYSVYLL